MSCNTVSVFPCCEACVCYRRMIRDLDMLCEAFALADREPSDSDIEAVADRACAGCADQEAVVDEEVLNLFPPEWKRHAYNDIALESERRRGQVDNGARACDNRR